MKKLTLLFVMALCLSQFSTAQGDLYLVFEFMKVDNEQGAAYNETESFWEKIHQQRVNNGEIQGWDLWSLQPGGEDQGYQYMTTTLYNDPVKMMSGPTYKELINSAKKAYPKMSEEELMKKIGQAGKTRDLATRVYLKQIATTKKDFKMEIGMLASFDLMKTEQGMGGAYVKAEKEVFMPNHEAMVEAGVKGSWSLLDVMLPGGSDTYMNYVTVNFYKDYQQFFKMWDFNSGEQTEAQKKAVQDGLATRDMKYVYMATLDKMVRKTTKIKASKD